jgi:hypothetical protein
MLKSRRTAALVASLALAAPAVGATTASAQIGKTNTAGAGNCTAWQSIKEAMFGVHCNYL